MKPSFFRELTPTEEEAFRAYARLNYELGAPISELWHPIAAHEAATMNLEAWRAHPYVETPEPAEA